MLEEETFTMCYLAMIDNLVQCTVSQGSPPYRGGMV